MSLSAAIENAKFSKFHRKLLIGCIGGPVLDGYMLSIIGISMLGFSDHVRATSLDESLVGASALIGIFAGAILLGPVIDRMGRRLIYTIDLWALVVLSVLQFVVQDVWQLVALRFLVGIAIGADYPVVNALLAEWLPVKQRGRALGMLNLGWFIGAAVASLVGFTMAAVYGNESWRWMLASSGVLGIIVVVMRHGIPESPRWLQQHGRTREAAEAVRLGLGEKVNVEAIDASSAPVPRSQAPSRKENLKLLSQPQYLRRLFFCGAFYALQVGPLFAIYTFGPTILKAFGLGDGNLANLGSMLIDVIFLVGCIPALRLVETIGRRPLIVWSFALMAIPLFVLGLAPAAPVAVIITCFCLYAFFSGGPNIMEWTYPSELFPTQVRATAVGITTAASRIGAAVGTFALPLALDHWGLGPTMITAAIVTAVGWLVCLLLAEETRGKPLEAALTPAESAGSSALETSTEPA